MPMLLIGILAGGVAIIISNNTGGGSINTVRVMLPELSAIAAQGQDLFNESCISCHGENASGSGNGPPLIHKIYRPGHHADGAFFNAALKGVRAHHWKFGNMPPVDGISQPEVVKIVRYLRELQRANGIL